MANRLKSSKRSSKPSPDQLKPEKEEQVRVKELVRDERTHKIAGTVLLLVAAFLFVAFASYIFTWKEDQDKVLNHGASILMPSAQIKTANLLGNVGAYVSHQFFFNGFGIASFFFSTLFFVMGANWLFEKKLFSVWRNVRYVLLGLIFFSVVFSFLMSRNGFPWGGAVGDMINDWLIKMLGTIGTAAVLLVTGLAYFIWRFNPAFSVPSLKKLRPIAAGPEPQEGLDFSNAANESEMLADIIKPNKLKGDKGVVVIPPRQYGQQDPLTELKVVEKDDTPFKVIPAVNEPVIPVAEEIKKALLKQATEDELGIESGLEKQAGNNKGKKDLPNLELEIKAVPQDEKEIEIVESGSLENMIVAEPYEPTLDLRDYKYPSLDLLEVHGSEKIVQDPAELEANKNQIINTLKNYDIAIQKISATVGPTVTLYEIVPAAGVRISRIKNLEDDIALSLAALGIRIIAPIPGKGTIGIEVPNVKKTIVSMKTVLASEKFQFNNFSLPIAIGKKIDNENFIVDLATMPHLLMAGATGQGKSVGVNAILVSLLYKKHPSQLKFVLVDPKKVELSLYRTIEKHFLAKFPVRKKPLLRIPKK